MRTLDAVMLVITPALMRAGLSEMALAEGRWPWMVVAILVIGPALIYYWVWGLDE